MPQWNSGSGSTSWDNRFGAGAGHWRQSSSSGLWVSGSSSTTWAPGGGLVPTFYQPFNSGLQNLDAAITANSTTVQPKFRLYGADATTSSWAPRTGSGTLAIAGSGSDVTTGAGSPLLGNDPTCVRYEGGKYFSSSSTTYDVTTGDVIWECVFQMDFSKANIGYGSKRGGSPIQGWDFISNSSLSAMRFNFFFNSVNTFIQVGGWADGVWYHMMVFIDRNENSTNGCAMYRNGQRIGTANPASTAGDASSLVDFYMGTHSFSPGTLQGTRSQTYLAMWEQASWFGGGAGNLTSWDAIAIARFRRMCGMYPVLAKGTSAPTICARNSAAHLDNDSDGGRRMYRVGPDWMRVEQWTDSNAVTKKSIRMENASTNLCPDSTVTVNSANTAITSNIIASPNESDLADRVTESTDGGPTTHTCEPSTATASISGSDAATYCISVFVKAINRTEAKLVPSTTANIDFDLDVNLSAGTVNMNTGNHSGIIAYTNGWYRIWVTATQSGAGSWNPQLDLMSSGSSSYTGTGTDAIYVWGWQVEQAGIPTSYIYTSGATATRIVDALRYKGDDGNLGGVGSEMKGTVKCDAWFYNGDNGSTAVNGCIWMLSDGGSINDKIGLFFNYQQGSDAGSGYGGTFASLADESWHPLLSTWSEDLLSHETRDNGVEIRDDAAPSGFPNDLDHIQIGGNLNGSQAGNVSISYIKIDTIARVVD